MKLAINFYKKGWKNFKPYSLTFHVQYIYLNNKNKQVYKAFDIKEIYKICVKM